MDDIRTFNFVVDTNIPVETYKKMKPAFPTKLADLPPLHTLRTRIAALAGLKPRVFHCCANSCCCFTGYLSDYTSCPYCKADRLDSQGRPRNTFTFFPLIPQLQAFFRCRKTCEAMQYRRDYEAKRNPDQIGDIFDADHYNRLKQTKVTIDGEEKPHCFFSNPRDIALGLSTDGFCPFKRRKLTCWPLLLFNYNLPPDVRTHLNNLICVGIIPGPSAPKDMNSFLLPLVDELIELAKGVKTIDVLEGEYFILCAHLLHGFGDIPAVAKLMEFLGHNGIFACRFCGIEGVSGRTTGGGCHIYCPLHRPGGNSYDPLNLPLRNHDEILRQGQSVLSAKSKTARKRLATSTGVKGISVLARLSSIDMAHSFPIDIMHMVMINLIPHLVKLWTFKFHEIDDGKEDYHITIKLWEEITRVGAYAGDHIPSGFGGRIPNLHTKKSSLTAEVWSLWGQYLAPIVLRRRFIHKKFYVHFMELLKILKLASEFLITRAELDNLRTRVAEWVVTYEKYVRAYTLCHSLNSSLGTTISATPGGCRLVQSICTTCYTWQIVYNKWVPYGASGRFLWNATVATLALRSRAADFRLPILHGAYRISALCA
jgi:hypothetical protein